MAQIELDLGRCVVGRGGNSALIIPISSMRYESRLLSDMKDRKWVLEILNEHWECDTVFFKGRLGR